MRTRYILFDHLAGTQVFPVCSTQAPRQAPRELFSRPALGEEKTAPTSCGFVIACADHSKHPQCWSQTPPEKSFAFIASLAKKNWLAREEKAAPEQVERQLPLANGARATTAPPQSGFRFVLERD